MKHSPSKQALPFAPNVVAGGLQRRAAKNEQYRADGKGRWKQKIGL